MMGRKGTYPASRVVKPAVRTRKKPGETLTLSFEEYEAFCKLRATGRVFLDTLPEGDAVPSLAQAHFEAALIGVEDLFS